MIVFGIILGSIIMLNVGILLGAILYYMIDKKRGVKL